MRHKKKRKWYLGIFLIVVLISIIYLTSRPRDFLFFEKPLKDLINHIEKTLQIPFTKPVSNNLIDLSLSNEKTAEIENLKSLLELKTILTDFSLIYATTINRNVAYFQELLTIDKGSADGIEKDFAVVTPLGLIGKVEKVSNHFSEVRLLTASEDQFQVSVVVDSQGESYYGVLNQYFIKDQVFMITGIPANAEISINSTVTTSGLGGVFPLGIHIGSVINSHNDTYGITKTIEVKASQDFNDLKYVAVLKTRGEQT